MTPSNTSLTTAFLFGLGLLLACSKESKPGDETGKPEAQTGRRSATLGRAGIFTTPAANPAAIRVHPDSERTAWAVLSGDGGTLTATAGDGTHFALTIPKNALAGPEEITLTPVASLEGLPAGASPIAAAQLRPDGLLLLQPATLEITPPKPLDTQSAFPIAWSGGGEDLHLYPLMPHAGAVRFQVSHFSGFAIASGSEAAMTEILQKEPQQCSARYFKEIADALAAKRRAALLGEEGGISEVVDRFVELSQSYFAEVIEPITAQVTQDDALLPCVMAELSTFERTFRLLAGDNLAESLFAQQLEKAWMQVYQASAVAFERAAERCSRNESPIFQFHLMARLSSFLASIGQESLLPDDAAARLMECGRTLEFHVDIDARIENTYREQGRGNDFSSSITTAKASGVQAVFDDQRSTQGRIPTFTTPQKAPLDATVTAVPRRSCPDRVRVKPGSNVGVTLTPILNSRVGKLICSGGRVRCESSDLNPGMMVQLAPLVVEEMYVHTKTASQCMDPGGWNEWMMFWEGSESTGAFEPFQVRGDQPAVTVVRRGTRTRGYLDLPTIERSLSRTSASVKVVRK